MKHIVQYSGGVGSAMAAYLVAKKVDKKDIILLFHDVKGGHCEDMYRFNKDFEKFIGLKITEISLEKDFWQVIEDNKCLPNMFIPFCTRKFKLEVADKYYKTLNESFVLYNGYCAEEAKRVNKAREKAKIHTEYPVFDAGLTSADCKRIISQEWGLQLPKAYQWFEHNNCLPCFKSTSKKYWRLVYEHYPERYQKAVEAEEKSKKGYTHFKNISLRQLAENWENEQTLF